MLHRMRAGELGAAIGESSRTLLPTLYYLVFAGLIGLVALYVLGVVDPLLSNN
ncbi:hypothetical protein [Halomonas ramblicola]|uniref:hypothetical protein n=1 Tax=Halomonas ramblicola TaxID=747349 RepID=UPI0025B5730E|nr:hypothetical protein [Halomonas ramblicola]MDN3521656.1 hypothetical protein [Halomonas ramblicola]